MARGKQMGFDRRHIRPRPLLLSIYYLTLPLPVLSVQLVRGTDGVDLVVVLVAVVLASVPLVWRFPDATPQPLTRIVMDWLKFAIFSYPISLGAWGVGLGAWYLYARDPSGHLNHELRLLWFLLMLYVPPTWLPTLASLLTARQSE
jgi:hypothetical protein